MRDEGVGSKVSSDALRVHDLGFLWAERLGLLSCFGPDSPPVPRDHQPLFGLQRQQADLVGHEEAEVVSRWALGGYTVGDEACDGG